MFVIGISSGIKAGHHDGGAVLMEGGRLIAASEEERFTLAKHARGQLPRGAIQFCLDYAGIRIEDVGYICSPLKTYPNYATRLEEYFRFQFGHSPKIELYDHHLCHAASTFYPSGFDEATVLCLDFSGDSHSGLVAKGANGRLQVTRQFPRNQSLGFYYGMITQYLGYQMTHDEYKVMGLASYGTARFGEEFDSILKVVGDGYELSTELDRRARDAHIFTTDFSTRQERIFTERLEEILGPRRLRNSPIEQKYIDVAATAQRRLEEVAVNIAKAAVASAGSKNICIAGGVGLNVKMNMEILDAIPGGKLFVPPVPHDAGVCYGAAILKMVELGYPIEPLRHAYYGPEYSADQIRKTLSQIGARYTETDDPVRVASEDLLAGKAVGWFQGRMEYGPRALGNRSILADPRNVAIKDRINATIKYREQYRPFCPSVIVETQNDFFQNAFVAPFMAVNCRATELGKQKIPGVVHIDGTSRIQSVERSVNPLYHDLISRFARQSGVGVLVNTSLNINEQPLVNSPLEAIHTYFCSGLDSLLLGNFYLSKQQ
jgi:carbamoyltransferase